MRAKVVYISINHAKVIIRAVTLDTGHTLLLAGVPPVPIQT